MSETNKTLRIRTKIGEDKYIPVNLTSEYDTLEILSLKINQKGAYRYHTSTYGVVVGRVLANNGFGVPNAKLSLFIAKDKNADVIENAIYPYDNISSKNYEGIRYNLLPSNQKDDCHQVVGTFPNKRMILDDNSVIEVFDKYYLYTTKTNEAGDYMFFGVPTGSYNIHMDLDVSDCGKLSQRPRDFLYKGYNIDQFENPNQFKIDTELSTLPQIFTQDTTIEVKPFWGDEQEGTNIGITREDININYKFEPTCVFIGSVISDTPNDGINKRCVPTNRMGDMREMVTGPGTIEIIRKTVNNTIEELQIKGKQLINGNGVWCFQIPMNLDYVTTDEYGNTIPTDNPDKGIPTRCEVRFRMSMDENEADSLQYKRGKILVPNNPSNPNKIDYEFGSKTLDESFKSLMWNGVYSVKSFIPRFQRARTITTNKFTGIKNVNIHGSNNPMPYNNIRIRIPFMFWLMCNIIKLFIRIITIINKLKKVLMSASLNLVNLTYAYLSNEICPDLEYWYFAPGMNTSKPSNTLLRRFWKWLTGSDNTCKKWQHESVCLTFKEIYDSLKDDMGDNRYDVFYQFIGDGNTDKPNILTKEEFDKKVTGGGTVIDSTSPDFKLTENYNVTGDYNLKSNWMIIDEEKASASPKDRQSTEVQGLLGDVNPRIKLTPDVDYLMQCVEMNLAQEYEVIKFDFYNDWINGVLYFPRWSRQVKFVRKRKNGKKTVVEKVKGCMDGNSRQLSARRYVQQCSLYYKTDTMEIDSGVGCGSSPVNTISKISGTENYKSALRCHKKQGADMLPIFGKKGGVVHEHKTMLGDNVYYMEPFEGNCPMFATDIIMLGSLSDCNEYGIISSFDSLVSTTYKLPTNLALTNVDDDSYSYVDNSTYDESDGKGASGPPTLTEIDSFSCGDKNKGCVLDRLAASGATKTIPSYQQLHDLMSEQGDLLGLDDTETTVVIDYEDIFPVTEMSGIEWGYTGPDQLEPDADSGNLFAPGGHFMGLACGSAQTNIRSCVNLKRACEIGTTFSERLEVPIGFRENPDDEDFDVVNYLFVSPNGLISKDQVVDVTYRSIFATLNQNSLKTITDPITKHKKYDFTYLIPDSFDGSLNKQVQNVAKFNARIPLKWDSYWEDLKDEEKEEKFSEFWDDIIIEQGFTTHRRTETKSDDYIRFRHGDDRMFLKGTNKNNVKSMPVYRNSFYFYFGLKNGSTALDEFRTQFLGTCAKSSIIGKEGRIDYKTTKRNTGFNYDVEIITSNLTSPINYEYINQTNGNKEIGKFDSNTFIIEDMRIGEYTVTVTDSLGSSVVKNIEVGIGDYTIKYNTSTIRHYILKETRTTVDEFSQNRTNGGCIIGDFGVTELKPNTYGATYVASIKKLNGDIPEIFVNDSTWNLLFDTSSDVFWCPGYGTYEVKINEYYNSVFKDSFIYGNFTVNDGISLPMVYLGNNEYKTEFNVLTIEEAKDLKYEVYRTIVNIHSDGAKYPFTLPFKCNGENSQNFTSVFAGKPERENEVYGEVVLSTQVPQGWKFQPTQIYLPSDYQDRGAFYYTAYNSNNVFATSFDKCIISEGKAVLNITDEGYYFCKTDSKQLLKKFDTKGSEIILTDESFNDGDELVYAKMLPCSIFVYPFAFRIAIVVDDKNQFLIDNQHVITVKYSNYLQSYKDTLYFALNGDKSVLTVKDYNDGNCLTKQFENVGFHKGNFVYSHSSDNDVIFTIDTLSENLKDKAEYYLITSSSNIPDGNNDFVLQKDGTFMTSYLNEQTYEDRLKGTPITVNYDGGGNCYGTINKSLNDIIDKDVWVCGKVVTSIGEYNTQTMYNNYCECHIMRPLSILSNMMQKMVFDNGVEIINPYKGGAEYDLYVYNDGAIFKLDKENYADEYIYKGLKLTYDGTRNMKCVVKVNTSNNSFRVGEIKEYEANISGDAFENISLNKFTTCFSQEEVNEGDKQFYKIIFKCGNNFKMIDGEEGNVVDNNSYEFVIAAFNVNDEIIYHTNFVDDAEINLSYNDLVSELKCFKILYVKKS